MNLAIETECLGKTYGTVKAVEKLSLRVAEGEIYAFLGLNGAAVLLMMTMNLAQILGWGEFFPWAVPVLYGIAKTPSPPSATGS